MFSNGLPCNLPFPSCLGVPKDSGSDELLPTSMGNREPVILNVYDMVRVYFVYCFCDENKRGSEGEFLCLYSLLRQN